MEDKDPVKIMRDARDLERSESWDPFGNGYLVTKALGRGSSVFIHFT